MPINFPSAISLKLCQRGGGGGGQDDQRNMIEVDTLAEIFFMRRIDLLDIDRQHQFTQVLGASLLVFNQS